MAGRVPIVLIIFGLRVFYRTIAQGTFHCPAAAGTRKAGAAPGAGGAAERRA